MVPNHDCNRYCGDGDHCDLVYGDGDAGDDELRSAIVLQYQATYGVSVRRLRPAMEAPGQQLFDDAFVRQVAGVTAGDRRRWLVWWRVEPPDVLGADRRPDTAGEDLAGQPEQTRFDGMLRGLVPEACASSAG